jgi:hypothetical protein
MKIGRPDKGKALERRLRAWLDLHSNDELVRQADALALRRDMVTLLTFVRDNKVVGTQTTGNMPLKALREVTARFVTPPALETTIGAQTFKVRSETDVWQLYFLHILAGVGALLKTGPARRWRLTPGGEAFLEADPLFQVSFLLSTWWHQVNWLVAYPYEGMGESLPPFFGVLTLGYLKFLPVRTKVPFEEFADRVIEKAGLEWHAPKSEFAYISLRGSIARMVIFILEDFGALQLEHHEEPLGKGTTSRLVAFEITPFGQALLDVVAQ